MTLGYDMYTRASYAAASRIIRRYSTSFSLATSLLDRRDRSHIQALYALVRVADEVVDGACPGTPDERLSHLRALEQRVAHAVATGFSTDLITHAFAHTARTCSITADLWEPFFASMRTDATASIEPPAVAKAQAAPTDLTTYIYGSAEVVGLMCVRIFFHGPPPATNPADDPAANTIDQGARALGNAFQRINFVRDYAHDSTTLGRAYLPELTDATKAHQIALIREQLHIARPAIDLLPGRTRMAVLVAHQLFTQLTDYLDYLPAATILTTRISVPARTKAAIVTRVLAECAPRLRTPSRTPTPTRDLT